jgi:hypothetical protein
MGSRRLPLHSPNAEEATVPECETYGLTPMKNVKGKFQDGGGIGFLGLGLVISGTLPLPLLA